MTKKNFYDIDTYITWAEKQLARLAKEHLRGFFSGELSLDNYYSILNMLRTEPRILYDLRCKLEDIFPFMQRMKRPQEIIFQYINLIETLYDTSQEDSLILLPKRARAEIPDKVEPATDEQVEAIEDVNEPKSLDEVASRVESPAKLVDAEIPSAEIPDKASELSNEPQPAPTTPEPAENSGAEIPESVDDTHSDVSSEARPDPLRTQCKELGIMLHKKKNYKQLLEQYDQCTLDPKHLSNKALKKLIVKKNPSARVHGKKRDELVEMYKANLTSSNTE